MYSDASENSSSRSICLPQVKIGFSLVLEIYTAELLHTSGNARYMTNLDRKNKYGENKLHSLEL